MGSRRGKNDTVSEGKFPFAADLRGAESDVCEQGHYLPLVHNGGNLECGVFTALQQHTLTHLENADGWDNERTSFLYYRGIKVCKRAIG
jgi:hypothetical protein